MRKLSQSPGIRYSRIFKVICIFSIFIGMARRKKNKRPYLTKRILVSAARSGVQKAAKETMDVMGFVVVAHDGWVVRKYSDGTIERIEPLESPENTKLVLD